MSQSTPAVVLLTNRKGQKELVNLDAVRRISPMNNGGSCVYFREASSSGLEIQEKPEEVLPLLMRQAMAALSAAVPDLKGMMDSMESAL